MKIKIKLFASLRKKLGKSECELDLSFGSRVLDAIRELNLSENDSYVLMLNGIHCQMDQELTDGDVLSIFPMIAGG